MLIPSAGRQLRRGRGAVFAGAGDAAAYSPLRSGRRAIRGRAGVIRRGVVPEQPTAAGNDTVGYEFFKPLFQAYYADPEVVSNPCTT